MGVWSTREAEDGWWEVYSLISLDFVYAKCPTLGQAKMVMWLLNGKVQIHSNG